MNEKWRRECRLPIPKGLRPSVQGWRASAYPGCAFGTGNNANGVAAHSPTLRQRRYVGLRIKPIKQPQRGCDHLAQGRISFVRKQSHRDCVHQPKVGASAPASGHSSTNISNPDMSATCRDCGDSVFVFLRSWRAKSRAAAVRGGAFPFLSPRRGED